MDTPSTQESNVGKVQGLMEETVRFHQGLMEKAPTILRKYYEDKNIPLTRNMRKAVEEANPVWRDMFVNGYKIYMADAMEALDTVVYLVEDLQRKKANGTLTEGEEAEIQLAIEKEMENHEAYTREARHHREMLGLTVFSLAN